MSAGERPGTAHNPGAATPRLSPWRGSSGAGRGAKLGVDDASDREQLATVDAARQGIATRIVDPVEHSHAVLNRVSKRGFPRRHRILAHQQRNALLISVLVHKKRTRSPIPGDQSPAHQCETDTVQVRTCSAKPSRVDSQLM